MDSAKISRIHQDLFAWWRQAGRILPWRLRRQEMEKKTSTLPTILREQAFHSYFAGHLQRDPYRVVVAELMLQQTQVDRVLPKYQNWMAKWPTITDLANVSLAKVLIFWQGLGYNRRARFLWLLAQEIVEKRQGIWPETEAELVELPGIGKYTARAILSFAFGQHVGVVDTNVRRILQRVFANEIGAKANEQTFFVLADQILPVNQSDPWNQALMDLGALMCTAKNPQCEECPLRQECSANLSAQKAGFADFATDLKTQQALPKKNPHPSKIKIRFTDTDRYFRGRIIDELRLKAQPINNLQKIMTQQYGLTDLARFKKLLAGLIAEGLLTQEENRARIG